MVKDSTGFCCMNGGRVGRVGRKGLLRSAVGEAGDSGGCILDNFIVARSFYVILIPCKSEKSRNFAV